MQNIDVSTFRTSDGSKEIAVSASWRLVEKVDFTKLIAKLPESIVICSPILVAGGQHVENLLMQALESWNRGIRLANKTSIDLLMRLSCTRQISDAVAASGISEAREIAIFGLASSEEEFVQVCRILEEYCKGKAARDDSLLELDSNKERFLKRYHSIPDGYLHSQIVALLIERSALLSFSK